MSSLWTVRMRERGCQNWQKRACEVGTHDRIQRIQGQGEARKARRLGRADTRRVRTESEDPR